MTATESTSPAFDGSHGSMADMGFQPFSDWWSALPTGAPVLLVLGFLAAMGAMIWWGVPPRTAPHASTQASVQAEEARAGQKQQSRHLRGLLLRLTDGSMRCGWGSRSGACICLWLSHRSPANANRYTFAANGPLSLANLAGRPQYSALA